MLQVSNLTKAYGSRTLFEDVTFSLNAGERLGLVGRNGSGKSTLFRLILGAEIPDSGQIASPRGYRVGHLAQHLNFQEDSVLKEACLGLSEECRDEQYRAEIILEGLGFAEEDLHKAPALCSGGFQIRINLAKLLLSEPNLLLLDEPTNYLDIISMRWLTSFLRNWQHELIIISHDRLFMDAITTHTMLIHRGRVRKMPGNTQKLYNQIEVDEEIYEKTRINEDKKRKDLELFINRFRAKASKASMVQSKIKALERMGQKEELLDEESLDFEFCAAAHPGKTLVDVTGLSFNYPDGPTLIRDLNITIGKHDRIGVVGKNGKGKSTLLRLLKGELAQTSGKVALSPHARIGYFGQTNIARLNPSLTVQQEIANANDTLHHTRVRSICGTMMFSGDAALKKVSVLSGGEKSRVLLGCILAKPSNMLLLDEPTNHLDMESIEALVESLKTYQGAVIIVTHSELILRELATRLIIFQGDTPRVFSHDYAYFLDKEGWHDEDHMTRSAPPKSESKAKSSVDRDPSNKKKPSGKVNQKISRMEDKILALEEELKDAEVTLSDACNRQALNEITSLSLKVKELQDKIEQHYQELEKLSQGEQTQKSS